MDDQTTSSAGDDGQSASSEQRTVVKDRFSGFAPAYYEPPRCDESFAIWYATDGHTPIALSIDGQTFAVKPSKRMRVRDGDQVHYLVERGHELALRAAWREARMEARRYGIIEPGGDPRLSPDERVSDLQRLMPLIREARRAASAKSDGAS